jgi:hypothetical protein
MQSRTLLRAIHRIVPARFRLEQWRSDWESADQRDPEQPPANAGEAVAPSGLDITVGTGGAFETRRDSGLYKTTHAFCVVAKNGDNRRFRFQL